MYHTFYFFSRLSSHLNSILTGSRLLECFSQQKDEVVLHFHTSSETNFYIKADLSQGNSILTFPSDFARTRSNSVDLFPSLYGVLVTQVRQTHNDRSFHIHFFNGLQLCFKMYGGRSNLLLHNGESVIEVLNHHLKKDISGNIPEDKDIENPMAFHIDADTLRKQNPLFSKRIWMYWELTSKGKSNSERESIFKEMMHSLLEGPMMLCRSENEVFLSFFPIDTILMESYDPILISNQLARYFWQVNQFYKQKEALISQLEQRIFESMLQLESSEKQKSEIEESRNYRLQADLLMAFSHLVEKGAQATKLPDFNGVDTVEIRLKKELSVVENAERYYRKAKGQYLDEERIQKRIESWRETISNLKSDLVKLINVGNWAEIKPFLKTSSDAQPDTKITPYHLRQFMDYEIWVGKNAKSNDEMLRLSHKDDLWLHARDVQGSHVIIRVKKGKITPQPVLMRAAEWAAFYSKAKNESLSAVMITERKFVRKSKNMLAGQVRVEKEKTLLVAPKE
jgi:predicted ribosome quality control (RQC) complex YloA/Tae2 family protein